MVSITNISVLKFSMQYTMYLCMFLKLQSGVQRVNVKL